MKIMHIGQMIGGLDVYIRNSIIYCKDNTMEFVIICGRKDKHQPVIKNSKPIKEHQISMYRKLNPLYDLIGFLQVIIWIIREKPDIIHCHSAKGGMLGRVAGWITKTKTLYTPHAFSYLCTASKLKKNIFLWLEQSTKMNAYLLACSESERFMGVQDVKYKKSHALVWHNAVPDASQIMKQESKTDNEIFACYIGRPCYQKNTVFLADVIKRVKDQGCPLKFLLLGVGYYSSELKQLKEKIAAYKLENTILLKPWLSHEECLNYIKQSLFYITTSRYEGLPLSVVEAMSLGKAIIASDVVGNRDCIYNERNGYLLPLDVETFATKINLLWNNHTLRHSFEKASREIFISDFLINTQIHKLHDIYMQLNVIKKYSI